MSAWRAGRLVPGWGPRLLFGWMYEDHRVETDALEPGSRVLAVASAGDTVAALAAAGHRVTAVDLNPTQLRYAAARLAGAPARAGQAERLQAAGRAAVRAAVPAWRPAALVPFLRLADPDRQARWWRERLDTPALRRLLRLALGPAGLVAVAVRPGLRDALPRRFDAVLRRRLAAGLARHPNADNPWAWRLLLGRDGPTGHLPAPAAGAVRLVRADLVDHLNSGPAGRYDAVALSNVLDGADPGMADRLGAALRHAVVPGGVLVARGFGDRVPLAGIDWRDRTDTDRCPLWGTVITGRLT